MGRIAGAAACLVAVCATSAAWAGPYTEYPAPVDYPFPRSILTRGRVGIAPYDQPFRVRVYTTPPQQPFYNVPPYAIITPY